MSTTAQETLRTPLPTDGRQSFLSFEEWQAEEKLKQPVEPVKEATASSSASTTEAVDNVTTDAHTTTESSTQQPTSTPASTQIPSPDASDKKDRFNHASFDCAASVVAANAEAKGTSNILKSTKDYYMLNPCSAASKFVIVELCNDILIDTIQLANYELFSGVFREVSLSVSAKYPPGAEGWTLLKNATAANVRKTQVIAVDNPLIWTRYLRIDMLSFYGNEFYCPLSLVRIFGKTMMEELKQEEADSNNARAIATATEPPRPPILIVPTPVMIEHDKLEALSLNMAEDFIPISSALEAVSIDVEVVTATAERLSTTRPTVLVPPAREAKQQRVEPGRGVCLKPVLQLRYPTSGAKLEGLTKADAQPTPEAARRVFQSREQAASATDAAAQKPAASSPPPPPQTQESIYKQINKRLNILESNATLAMRYVEAQSALLARSFVQLSASQAKHLTEFLQHVNATIVARTESLRQDYQDLYMTAMANLEGTRRRQEKDLSSTNRQLDGLTTELVFFKRLTVFQSILSMLLLVLIFTGRTSNIDLGQQLNRALSRHSTPGSPMLSNNGSTRMRWPSASQSWRQHLRFVSSPANVDQHPLYSFPIEQITRPTTPTSTVAPGKFVGFGRAETQSTPHLVHTDDLGAEHGAEQQAIRPRARRSISETQADDYYLDVRGQGYEHEHERGRESSSAGRSDGKEDADDTHYWDFDDRPPSPSDTAELGPPLAPTGTATAAYPSPRASAEPEERASSHALRADVA